MPSHETKPLVLGTVYGQLTVIEKSNEKRYGYRCLCTCGKEKVITKAHLKSGAVKSCGCLLTRTNAIRTYLEGKRFGKLLVKSWAGISHLDRFGGNRKQGNSFWNCLCDCGVEKKIQEVNLKNGNSKSCGCMIKERAKALNRTHGLSKTKIFRIYTGFVYITKTSSQSHLIPSFEEFNKKLGNDFSKFTNPVLERIDLGKPISLDNLRFVEREYAVNGLRPKYKENMRHGVTVNGRTETLSFWGTLLGITRERARQLDNEGRLVERVVNLLERVGLMNKAMPLTDPAPTTNI